jgi:hypothetical protein
VGGQGIENRLIQIGGARDASIGGGPLVTDRLCRPLSRGSAAVGRGSADDRDCDRRGCGEQRDLEQLDRRAAGGAGVRDRPDVVREIGDDWHGGGERGAGAGGDGDVRQWHDQDRAGVFDPQPEEPVPEPHGGGDAHRKREVQGAQARRVPGPHPSVAARNPPVVTAQGPSCYS